MGKDGVHVGDATQLFANSVRFDLFVRVCRTYVGREFVLARRGFDSLRLNECRMDRMRRPSLSLGRIIILLEFWLLLFDEDAVVNKITTRSHQCLSDVSLLDRGHICLR